MLALLTHPKDQLVDGRQLHSALGLDTDFRTWINNKIKQHRLLKPADYTTKCYPNITACGSPKVDYFLKLEVALDIALLVRNANGRKVRKELIKSYLDR